MLCYLTYAAPYQMDTAGLPGLTDSSFTTRLGLEQTFCDSLASLVHAVGAIPCGEVKLRRDSLFFHTLVNVSTYGSEDVIYRRTNPATFLPDTCG